MREKYFCITGCLLCLSINYMHGQFDVIPIAFLIGSLFLLFKEKYVPSAIVLGMGLATKTNLILVIPFYLLYIWKNNNHQRLKKTLLPLGVILVVTLFLNGSFLGSSEFVNMVYKNQEQSKIWNAGLSSINNLSFYLIPAVFLILLAAAMRFNHISKDLFMMFIGFSFAALLIFIPPQPGWYFWILPLSYLLQH